MPKPKTVESAFSKQRRGLQEKSRLTPFQRHKQNPTPALRNALVEANQGLAQKEARRWAHQCPEPFEDLCQVGMIGLIRAIDKFDPDSGNAFSSFAVPWIRGAIQHYLRRRGWGDVRPPVRALEEYARVQGARRFLIEKGHPKGQDLAADEVAKGLGIPKRRWEFIKQAREAPTPISLDEPDSSIEIEDCSETLEDLSWVYGYLDELPKATRDCIVAAVFSDFGHEEIAKRRGIDPTVVAGLISTGLAAMRAKIEAEGRYADD
ncbi:MAG: sigma-70 family RNA polymerase sigma factor [Cyanobacteria bacterium P01_A01_bin.123]